MFRNNTYYAYSREISQQLQTMEVAQKESETTMFNKSLWWVQLQKLGIKLVYNVYFRYRCPLKNYNTSLSTKPCKWRGDIEDYITHVKTYHSENFLEIHTFGEFRWKLPNNGDQQDIGIIKYGTDYYIYEMFYSFEIGKLYFSLNCFKQPQNVTSYVFYLHNTEDHVPKYYGKTISNVSEIVKPIYERSTTTKLCKHEVQKYLQYYGHFTWKLIIV